MATSPITISSSNDFVQFTYEDSPTTITSGTPRVPVSGKSKKYLWKRTSSNTTVTNEQKVATWMDSLGNVKNTVFSPDASDSKMSATPISDNVIVISDISDVGEKVEDSEDKSLIIVQCNFDKSGVAPLRNGLTTNHRNSIVNGVSPINNSTKISAKKFLQVKPVSVINKSIHLSPLPSRRSSDASTRIENRSDSSSDIYEVPLSPASQKKELYSYLQLMNPADKKEKVFMKNRRSTRVKNLCLMQEKRQLKKNNDEKNLNGFAENDKKELKKKSQNVSEDCGMKEEKIKSQNGLANNDLSNFPTLKSLSELNMKVNKPKPVLDDTFTFPFPPKQLMRQRSFDLCMKRFLNSPCNSQYNKTRTNSLRSTGKYKNVRLKSLLLSPKKEMVNLRSRSRKITSKENRMLYLKRKKFDQERKELMRKAPIKAREEANKLAFTELAVQKPVDNVDFDNCLSDILDFDQLSLEHKMSIIETRNIQKNIVSSTKSPKTKFTQLNSDELSPLLGFSRRDLEKVEEFRGIYMDMASPAKQPDSNLKQLETKEPNAELLKMKLLLKEEVSAKKQKIEYVDVSPEVQQNDLLDKIGVSDPLKEPPVPKLVVEPKNLVKTVSDKTVCKSPITISAKASTGPMEVDEIFPIIRSNGDNCLTTDHDYANTETLEEEDSRDSIVVEDAKPTPKMSYEEVIPQPACNGVNKYQPFSKQVQMKSLHGNLTYPKRKQYLPTSPHTSTVWDSPQKLADKKNQSHSIYISKDNGVVLYAFYIDYNLIISQEYVVSLWTQTALGNVLGAQNMWIPKGHVQRLVLDNKCIQKESMEMVISMENNVAYVELWTKEHKSDIREGPVADVFATVYFWKQRQNGLDKKVIQLENIKGFADDVQYVVSKCSPKIIVSWHSVTENKKTTYIHAYQLAPDYQTVSNIYEIEPISHYVSSLHNIEDCDNLIMGCGENKITVWNLEFGYIVATIELSDIKSPLSTLWVKSDRGFLFTLQQCVDRELRLIGINGMNLSWKRLATYNPPAGFDRLRGVCIENGILVSFYDQGILCWNAQTGEPVIEEIPNETEYIPCGKYVIMVIKDQIIVRHAITHLIITADDS